MIEDKTVFILGAGASYPYGFPTAAGLRFDIVKQFNELFIREYARHKVVPIKEAKRSLPYQELVETFRKSSTKSFDLFLSRNKQFNKMGKHLISFLISNYERQSKFREDIAKPQSDWYMHIYNLLTKEISRPDDLISFFEKNAVSFITFNYDRSLEHFLYESLLNSFTTKRDAVVNLMSKIKIIHVYGRIAPLMWESNGFTQEYGSVDYYDYLDELSENIKIIYEERKDDLTKAKELISEAKNIFFLGFGYADENLDVLDFSRNIKQEHNIYGTGLGFTDVEINKIKMKLKINNYNFNPGRIKIEDCDSVMLLRRHL